MTSTPLTAEIGTPDDDPIPLKDAAKRYGILEATLRTEASRGRLTIYRIGRKDYTTPKDIREMVQLCRVEKRRHDFTSTPSASSGLSETEAASSELAAAREAVLMLRRSSPGISDRNTSRSRRARQG